MFKAIKTFVRRTWRAIRVSRAAAMVGRELGKDNLVLGKTYEDDKIRLTYTELFHVTEVFAKLDGKYVAVFQADSHNGVSRFRDGCWVDHLISLVPAAQEARRNRKSGEAEVKSQNWEPIDDCR